MTAVLSSIEEVVTSGGNVPPVTPLVRLRFGKKRCRELSGAVDGAGGGGGSGGDGNGVGEDGGAAEAAAAVAGAADEE